MKKRTALLSIVLFTLHVDAQTPDETRPRLVVGVVVDQMRPDYVQRFWNKLGDGGFKRLLKDGFHCRNTQYNYAPTYTGPGHASIYAGTTPSVHGIAGNDWYDEKSGDTVYCAYDPSVTGVGSSSAAGKMSPSRLLTTTITDQLKLSHQMKAKVIGISLKDRGAILPTGRSADAAYWFDGSSGNWITSSWYRNELPPWLIAFNERRWPDEYLSKPWKTSVSLRDMTESDPDDSPYEAPFAGEKGPVFPHDLPALRGSNYDLIRKVPYGNTMTKDLALAAIAGENMGDDAIPDFLAISFSATDYIGHQFGPNAVETEDAYIRLDKDIADLLQFLDNRIGEKQYLLFLTADHACAENPKFLKDQQLEGGFSSSAALQDTVRYWLQKTYGAPGLMRCIINDQVYLDEALAESKGLSVCEIAASTAQFVRRSVEGVYQTYTSCDLEKCRPSGLLAERIQAGLCPLRSGHVCVLYKAGWTDPLYGPEKTCGTTHGSPFSYDAHVPLFWYGWKIPSGSTADEVHITDIAPTLAFMLQITLPNACTGRKIDALVH